MSAKYTVEVRTICESVLGMEEPGGYEEIQDILNRSAPKIFNFYFPIWDETYRLTLETKILKHYYMREIGAESVGLWKLWLDERLNLIMPYYNELYKTALMDFNPYYDVDLTTDHSGDNSRKGNNVQHEIGQTDASGNRFGNNTKHDIGSSTRNEKINAEGEGHDQHTGSDVNRYSDTPQGALVDIEKDKYLTNATLNNDSAKDDNTHRSSQNTVDNRNNQNTESTQFNEKADNVEKNSRAKMGSELVDTTEKYVNHVYGANGNRTYASKLLEFRQAIINIDALIIEELKDLFFALWG